MRNNREWPPRLQTLRLTDLTTVFQRVRALEQTNPISPQDLFSRMNIQTYNNTLAKLKKKIHATSHYFVTRTRQIVFDINYTTTKYRPIH